MSAFLTSGEKIEQFIYIKCPLIYEDILMNGY